MNDGIYNSISNIYSYNSILGKNLYSNGVQTPANIDNKLDWKRCAIIGWEAIKSSMRQTILQSNTFSIVKFTKNATFLGGTNAYLNGAIMMDGRIILCPFTSTSSIIYDPINDSTYVPAGTYSGTNAHSSCVLLPTGEVLFIPRTSACRVYNPFTNTTRIIGSTPAVANSYNSGVLMHDGRVYCIPSGVTTGLIIDPIRETTTVPPGTISNPSVGQAVADCNSGVLLPDGRVFMISARGNGNFGIYDPIKNTTVIKQNPFYFNGVWPRIGGVLTVDDYVIMNPSAGDGSTVQLLIYDWKKDVFKPSKFSLPNANSLGGGTSILPDGRIFLMNNSGGSSVVYDPYSDTGVLVPGALTVNDYSGCCILPDGRLILYPRSATKIIGYGFTGPSFSKEVLLSAHNNYRR
ncbi:MAG: hypothetical protein EBU90_05930 [Proteobacteria bacterium]|nr:hypothetical protein [Pseudomonadota bacterium]NBP15048.1 hypothetical protein [bacterium]